MRTYRLSVPRWIPPRANQWRGRHWSVAHRLRKQAEQFLALYAREQAVLMAVGRRRVAVEVRLPPRARTPDLDAYDKLLLDALVRCRLLLDDSARGLEGRAEVTFKRGTAADWGTTITLTDLEV